jgi:hypothetical protein
MHTYSVQFRLSSKSLDPNEATRRLDLQPSQIRIAGENRSAGKPWVESLWAYDGSTDPHAPVKEWNSLEEGLIFVLHKLLPKRDLIQTYTKSVESIWWCGHFQSTFDGGPTLSAPLMKELADFGTPVFIDNYFRTDL